MLVDQDPFEYKEEIRKPARTKPMTQSQCYTQRIIKDRKLLEELKGRLQGIHFACFSNLQKLNCGAS